MAETVLFTDRKRLEPTCDDQKFETSGQKPNCKNQNRKIHNMITSQQNKKKRRNKANQALANYIAKLETHAAAKNTSKGHNAKLELGT